MKNLITLIVTLFISFSSFAQPESINYKAVIKDANGNLVVSQTLNIKFTILKFSGNIMVYQETHTDETTDANGILIVNIGQGTPMGPTGPMINVDWGGSNIYKLKTEIDLEQDGSFVSLGETQFNSVPYALYAPDRSSGLELITEEATPGVFNTGWRLKDVNPNVFGSIGLFALDLSTGGSLTNDFGATAYYSVAIGKSVRASGEEAISIGNNTNAESLRVTAMGSNNIGGGTYNSWFPQDPLFEIGNSIDSNNKSNALTILKNGTITAPSFDISEIIDDKALVTKEYLDTTNSMGLEQITEGTVPNEHTGWRLKGFEPNNYGDIGDYAVDLSYSSSSLNTNGAIGFISFAAGNRTRATNSSSTAMGSSTVASGLASTALGGNTTASGNFSTTMGNFTSASGDYATAMGTVNFDDPNALLMVGNGANLSNPNNVFTVYKNGTSEFDGDVRIKDALLKGFVSGSFSIGNVAGSSRVGLYDNNGWEPTFNNTVRLGSSAYRWTEIWSVNPLNTSSDRRLKKDINPINYGLDAVMNLKPVSYRWKKGEQDTKLGFIAQDVESVVPEIVKQESTSAERKAQLKKEGREIPEIDYYALSYTELIPIVVKALQEQQKIIESQNASLNNEKQINANQNAMLETLLKRIESLEKEQSN